MSQFIFTFFNADIAARYWPDIVHGMGITVLLSLAVIAAGLVLGLALAIVRATQRRVLTLLVVRSFFEERVLTEAYPEYVAYRAKTARFVPGII